jgi:hypothetical protein
LPDAPGEYGPAKTLYNRDKRWALRTFRCPETFKAAAHIAAVVIW